MYEYKRAGTTHPAITTKYFVCFRETFTSLIFKTSLPSPDIQTGNQTFKFGGLMFVLAFQSDDLQFISRNGFRERLEIFSKRVQDLDKCLGMDDALFLKYLNDSGFYTVRPGRQFRSPETNKQGNLYFLGNKGVMERRRVNFNSTFPQFSVLRFSKPTVPQI